MSRKRKVIIAICAALCLMVCAALFAVFREKPVPPVNANITVASDLHYIAPGLTDHGEYFQKVLEHGDGKTMEYCEEITDAFLEQVLEEAPDVLILSGDLTFNGARQSHEALAEKLKPLRDAEIPVLVLPGNHDLRNQNAASFQGGSYTLVDSIDSGEFAEIYSDFGYNAALSRDSASLSYVFQLTPELRVLLVDVNTVGSAGIAAEETLLWVEKQLKAAKRDGCRVLAVSHQNLVAHSKLFGFGYVIANSSALQELYEKYGVLCNLSGHMHIQHTSKSEAGLRDIATSSLLMYPLQYGRLTFSGRLASYHAVQVETPYTQYAHDYHWQHCYSLAAEEGGEADELGRFFADVNLAYFAGHVTEELWNDELYEKLKSAESRSSQYLTSIYEDGFQNHQDFSFDF